MLAADTAHLLIWPTACDPEVCKVLLKTLDDAVAVAHKVCNGSAGEH